MHSNSISGKKNLYVWSFDSVLAHCVGSRNVLEEYAKKEGVRFDEETGNQLRAASPKTAAYLIGKDCSLRGEKERIAYAWQEAINAAYQYEFFPQTKPLLEHIVAQGSINVIVSCCDQNLVERAISDARVECYFANMWVGCANKPKNVDRNDLLNCSIPRDNQRDYQLICMGNSWEDLDLANALEAKMFFLSDMPFLSEREQVATDCCLTSQQFKDLATCVIRSEAALDLSVERRVAKITSKSFDRHQFRKSIQSTIQKIIG